MAFVPFTQRLSTNGDGTGTTSIVADYGTVGETFEVANPSSVAYTVVSRIIVFVQDTGVFSQVKFGATTALTNGIVLDVQRADDSVLYPLTAAPIKKNGDWAALMFDVDVKAWGVGDEALVGRWTFSKFVPGGLVLKDGARLVAAVDDDMTDLVDFVLTAQGYTSVEY